MSNMDRNKLEIDSAEIAPKKSWQKPEISELKASLTSGVSKATVGIEQTSTSPS